MPMNICNAVMKDWEGKSLKEIAAAPLWVLQGVTEEKAKLIEQGLGVKTIGDLGTNKFFEWAQAIAKLANCEE